MDDIYEEIFKKRHEFHIKYGKQPNAIYLNEERRTALADKIHEDECSKAKAFNNIPPLLPPEVLGWAIFNMQIFDTPLESIIVGYVGLNLIDGTPISCLQEAPETE